MVPDVLPEPTFTAVRDEVEAHLAAAHAQHPMPANARTGFQPKQPFPGGFDRYDGGTLNRFLHIDPATLPHAAAVTRDPRLSRWSRKVIGVPMDSRKVDIYLTVHGEESRTPDLQKDLHRDTFFRALKFWLFLRPVTAEDGPFEVVPGSHRLTPERLRWEQATANAAIRQQQQPDVSGSFRIQEKDLRPLGCRRRWPCPAKPTPWCWRMCSPSIGVGPLNQDVSAWPSTAGTVPTRFCPSPGEAD